MCLWLQATQFVIGNDTSSSIFSGVSEMNSVTSNIPVLAVPGWPNSPGVAHSMSVHDVDVVWSPGCPAGCSHLSPSRWKAQHCLMLSIVPPVVANGGEETGGKPLPHSHPAPSTGGLGAGVCGLSGSYLTYVHSQVSLFLERVHDAWLYLGPAYLVFPSATADTG